MSKNKGIWGFYLDKMGLFVEGIGWSGSAILDWSPIIQYSDLKQNHYIVKDWRLGAKMDD